MKDSYECPRCGYKTMVRQNMYKHLFFKKTICQSTKNTIELSDEVKNDIITNRKWICPVVQPVTVTNIYQNITNYQQINNVIGRMDVMDKINKYMSHCGEELLDFEDHVSQTYQSTIHKLDNDTFKDFSMSPKTFLEIIDTLTTCESIDKLNVLYDEQSEKLKFVEFGTWKSKMLESGVDEIISKIQSGYLDYYEEYLLRKCQNSDTYLTQVIHERLEDYYRFVVCFDLDPCVKDESYLEDPKTEHIYNIYRNVRYNLKKVHETRIRREVTKIIRRNCKASIIDLNKKIMDLIQVDEGFKKHVLDEFSKFTTSLGVLEAQ